LRRETGFLLGFLHLERVEVRNPVSVGAVPPCPPLRRETGCLSLSLTKTDK